MLTFNMTRTTNRSGRPLLGSALHKLFCTHPNCKVNVLPNIIRYFSRIIAFYFSLLLKFLELVICISRLTKLLSSFSNAQIAGSAFPLFSS